MKKSGKNTKANQLIELVNDFFANRCFFCERGYNPGKEKMVALFNLCQSSCSQRYKIIAK
jgi:hypothetical protein